MDVRLNRSQLVGHVARVLVVSDDSDNVVHGVPARGALHTAGVRMSNVHINEI